MGVWVRYHITTHEMCRTKRRGKRAAQARAPAATRAVTRVPAPQTQVASVTQRRSQRRPRKTQRIPSRSQAVEVRERLTRKRKAGRWIFNPIISSRCQPWSVSGSSEWIPLPSQESFRLAGSQEKVSIAQETLAQVPCHEEAKNNQIHLCLSCESKQLSKANHPPSSPKARSKSVDRKGGARSKSGERRRSRSGGRKRSPTPQVRTIFPIFDVFFYFLFFFKKLFFFFFPVHQDPHWTVDEEREQRSPTGPNALLTKSLSSEVGHFSNLYNRRRFSPLSERSRRSSSGASASGPGWTRGSHISSTRHTPTHSTQWSTWTVDRLMDRYYKKHSPVRSSES